MAEERLHGANVVSVLEEMGGKRVPKGVTGDALRDADSLRGGADGVLQDGFVQVMAAPLAGFRVAVRPRCGEDPLPAPITPGTRRLARQRQRQLHPTRS